MFALLAKCRRLFPAVKTQFHLKNCYFCYENFINYNDFYLKEY